jgi:phosphoglycerate kinase
MSHRVVTDLHVAGQVVFCRVDFNVPLDRGTITDDRRIRASLPTIRWLAENGARVVCASHLGRPKGQRVPEMSLTPVAQRLGELLGRAVPCAADCVGDEASRLARSLQDGDVGLLENLRYYIGEEKGDLEFARQLAAPCQLYVNDAFGAAHRVHASVVGVPRLLGGGATGFLMDKELAALGRLLERPERPYVAILGGAKVTDKIELIEKLLERVDRILVGGAMAYTFLAARGVAVGASLVESDKLELARELAGKAQRAGVSLELPVDHVTATKVGKRTAEELQVVAGQAIPDGRAGVDIGPETLARWRGLLDGSVKTVFWNGPVGMFEAAGCDAGTRGLGQHLARMTAFRVLGGGDTAAAAERFNVAEAFDHVSTGGGAALEFLSGIQLPGVAALEL